MMPSEETTVSRAGKAERMEVVMRQSKPAGRNTGSMAWPKRPSAEPSSSASFWRFATSRPPAAAIRADAAGESFGNELSAQITTDIATMIVPAVFTKTRARKVIAIATSFAFGHW